MKYTLLVVAAMLAMGLASARADEAAAAKGKELVAEKKCTMCHYTDEAKPNKKPMKAAGKSDEWIAKFLAGEEKTESGKTHPFKGKLTDDEKKALIEYIKTVK